MSHCHECEESEAIDRDDATGLAYDLLVEADEAITAKDLNAAQVLNQVAQTAVLLAQTIPVPQLPKNVIPIGIHMPEGGDN